MYSETNKARSAELEALLLVLNKPMNIHGK